jgi:ABC-2 type transport system ATP-binding protein
LCRNIAIINDGLIVEKTSMSELLGRINVDHFVLDIAQPIATAPSIEGYAISLISSQVIEVAVPKSLGFNPLFAGLSAQHISVLSLKNKSNRLEQLVIDLVQ